MPQLLRQEQRKDYIRKVDFNCSMLLLFQLNGIHNATVYNSFFITWTRITTTIETQFFHISSIRHLLTFPTIKLNN